MTQGLGCVMTETALVKCTVKQQERKGETSLSRVTMRADLSDVAYMFNLESVNAVNV